FFFSSRRRHTRCYRDWSSDVCSSDLGLFLVLGPSEVRTEDHGPWTDKGRTTDQGLHVIERLSEILFQVLDVLDSRRDADQAVGRSEERRVGKECRSRGGACTDV